MATSAEKNPQPRAQNNARNRFSWKWICEREGERGKEEGRERGEWGRGREEEEGEVGDTRHTLRSQSYGKRFTYCAIPEEDGSG